jgi:hypothetical protein
MKKLTFLFILGIFTLSTVVNAGTPDYIQTRDDVKFYSKVRTGLLSVLIGVDDSGRTRYDIDEVVAYRKNGRVYEKMPVISDNKETGRYAFMELVSYRNGLKVFKHEITSGLVYPAEAEYLVFRNGSYVVHFDHKNVLSLNEFFFGPSRFYASK